MITREKNFIQEQNTMLFDFQPIKYKRMKYGKK
jgi:hypothetical protein